ncbi:ethanolamine transporter [Halobacillus karajensis]|uniref:Ethanolamine utilization protein EutH n=1 Tax=Halobacillus karajensis TaxID=195088 RepID=A0A024P6N9_9BACI|nr:ethanolamine utilization protein EutH [Halobacillus karajensis]CDQ20514.1 ethanolamine utilization protein EutH [Halobacillus karajensis]CDQ24017.1 ethanolamine utilization protein EutH [Halobacillus karajensis]CDQ27495.1 ethanolamine utilization protein EutH [Halobacillus karajensis]SEH90591.1 ethanolamine transporter [Halobacillus karajensis]
MWFNEAILIVMCIFMVLGALDYYILDHRLSLGWRFYEAFMMMGPLALSMVGIISLAPVLSEWLAPLISPLFLWFGADPSMFASMMLAIDMGAYPLAESLAMEEKAAVFSWALLGTMMGPTLVFTIPVALTIIKKEDRPFFSKGILAGLITVPVGCFIGGVLAGYEWSWLVRNLTPAILLSVFIGAGLWLFTNITIRLFSYFGKAVEIIIITGLIFIIIETLTDFVIIQGMAPLSEGVIIVGRITVTLAGAYPLVAFINQRGEKIMRRLSEKTGMNVASLTGLIASTAHHLPMLATMKDMDRRGKTVNAAFAVSGAFVVGSHFAFVASVEKAMIFPVLIGKLTAGILAVGLALWMTRENEGNHSYLIEEEAATKNLPNK